MMNERKTKWVSFKGIPLNDLYDDAARWRYVRDNLLRAHSLHMDGTSAFSFSFPGRGLTVDEVIDRLIAEQEKNHD